jgi:hypothetical protein
MFFYGVDATKKPTAAPLGADNTYRSPFLCPQEENDPRTFFLVVEHLNGEDHRLSCPDETLVVVQV